MRFADLRARRATTATENGALDDDAEDRWFYPQYACPASSVGAPGLREIDHCAFTSSLCCR
ncbi:MAG: hypothetical protein AAFX06_34385, partial [Planctomycetota bacterium]